MCTTENSKEFRICKVTMTHTGTHIFKSSYIHRQGSTLSQRDIFLPSSWVSLFALFLFFFLPWTKTNTLSFASDNQLMDFTYFHLLCCKSDEHVLTDWPGNTHIVVSGWPAGVQLRVEESLFPSQFVIFGLFLLRQRVPLWTEDNITPSANTHTQ